MEIVQMIVMLGVGISLAALLGSLVGWAEDRSRLKMSQDAFAPQELNPDALRPRWILPLSALAATAVVYGLGSVIAG